MKYLIPDVSYLASTIIIILRNYLIAILFTYKLKFTTQ